MVKLGRSESSVVPACHLHSRLQASWVTTPDGKLTHPLGGKESHRSTRIMFARSGRHLSVGLMCCKTRESAHQVATERLKMKLATVSEVA